MEWGKTGLKSISSQISILLHPLPFVKRPRRKKSIFPKLPVFFVGIQKKSVEKPLKGLELFAAFWYNNTH